MEHFPNLPPTGCPAINPVLPLTLSQECNIEAYPPPAIKWYRDNILLNNNQHYQISHFAHDDEYTDTILRVITIEKKQYANYSCKAINILGEAEGKVELFETVIPICPPACDDYNYSSGAEGATAAAVLGAAATALAVVARARWA